MEENLMASLKFPYSRIFYAVLVFEIVKTVGISTDMLTQLIKALKLFRP